MNGHPLPDYGGGGIVNLMSTLAESFGAAARYRPLEGFDRALLDASRTVVLLVVDGLGYNRLQRSSSAPTLAGSLERRLTSVFPTTTSTAITTFLTGLAPQQHGLTGWFMYFEELDDVIAPLLFKSRSTGKPLGASRVEPGRLFDNTAFADSLPARAHAVSPASIAESPFNVTHCGGSRRERYRSREGLFDKLAGIAREGGERRYVYAYYPVIDELSHAHGSGSPRVERELAALDRGFAQFIDRISGTPTTVLVTADHGFMDVPDGYRIELSAHRELAECLTRPLCGEPRAAYCHVAPDKPARFERYVESALGGVADLYPSQELVEASYFGPGAPHPQLSRRVGDYTLIMRDAYMIKDWMGHEDQRVLRGVHGGLSDDELYVPLCIARGEA